MRDPEAPSLVRLPEHVVLEILARVPGVDDLFRCAAARKRWRDLVTEPSFLRRRWPEGACHCSSLVGFLGRERCRGGAGPPGSSFVRAPGSVLGPGRPLLGSFVPGAAGLLDDRVVPLASHRGVLLVRFETEAEAEPEPGVDRLAVCNLLSGACHVLPPLRCDWFFDYFGTSAHAVLTGADCCPDDGQRQAPDPASFKVLVVGVSDDRRHYVLRTFSSGEPSWSMYILHLESGAMEEVTDHLRGLRDYKTAMAVEIDWPAFFVCRLLGGKAHV